MPPTAVDNHVETPAEAQQPFFVEDVRLPSASRMAPWGFGAPVEVVIQAAERPWTPRLRQLAAWNSEDEDVERIPSEAFDRADEVLVHLEDFGYPTDSIAIFAGEEGEVRLQAQDAICITVVSVPAAGLFHFHCVQIRGGRVLMSHGATPRSIASALSLVLHP